MVYFELLFQIESLLVKQFVLPFCLNQIGLKFVSLIFLCTQKKNLIIFERCICKSIATIVWKFIKSNWLEVNKLEFVKLIVIIVSYFRQKQSVFERASNYFVHCTDIKSKFRTRFKERIRFREYNLLEPFLSYLAFQLLQVYFCIIFASFWANGDIQLKVLNSREEMAYSVT